MKQIKVTKKMKFEGENKERKGKKRKEKNKDEEVRKNECLLLKFDHVIRDKIP